MLRENEPHPVGSLMSGPKLIQDSRDDRILSLNKVLKIHTINPFSAKLARS
jgi:hypothetical protein